MDKKYSLWLRCLNCLRNFKQEFDWGFRVEEDGYSFTGKTIRDENRELVKCPNCGCTNIIKTDQEEKE